MNMTIEWRFVNATVANTKINGYDGVVMSVDWDCLATDDAHPDAVGRTYGQTSFEPPPPGDKNYVPKTEKTPTRADMMGWVKDTLGKDAVAATEAAAQARLAEAITPPTENFVPPE